MKFKKLKRVVAAGCAAVMTVGLLSGCGKKAETNENGDEVVELTWYQVGDAQKDAQMVIDEVNKYTSEKIGVKLNDHQCRMGRLQPENAGSHRYW